MVISIAVGVVSLIMIFVIPKFKRIFQDFHTDLPAVTRVAADHQPLVRRRNMAGRMFCVSPIVIRAADQADPHERRRKISC